MGLDYYFFQSALQLIANACFVLFRLCWVQLKLPLKIWSWEPKSLQVQSNRSRPILRCFRWCYKVLSALLSIRSVFCTPWGWGGWIEGVLGEREMCHKLVYKPWTCLKSWDVSDGVTRFYRHYCQSGRYSVPVGGGVGGLRGYLGERDLS